MIFQTSSPSSISITISNDSWDYPGTEAVAVGHPFAGRNEAGDHCGLDVAKGFIRIVAATLW
jgi:hypothetical protein